MSTEKPQSSAHVSAANQAAKTAKDIADKLQEKRQEKLAEASDLNTLSAQFLRIGDVYGRIDKQAGEIPFVSMGSGLASLESFKAFIATKESKEFTNPFIANLTSSAGTMASAAATLYSTACPEAPFDVTLFIDRGSAKKKFVAANLPQDISKTYSGALESFDQGVFDSERGAALLMREAVRHFVAHHVADDEVKKAVWFKPDPTSKNGVTRRQRIKLMVEKNYAPKDRELKENLFNGFDDLYDDLSEAHKRGELKKEAVETFLNNATELFHSFLMDTKGRI